MDREPKSVDVADFVASRPKIVEELDSGATRGVDIVRSGEVGSHLRAPRGSLHGSMHGCVHIPEGFDLTAPVVEDEAFGHVDAIAC